MKTKIKLLFRRPIVLILMILLLGTISFGFVSKITEYLVIDQAIEEISKYYRSIGYLTVIDSDDYYVESGAELFIKK